MPPAPPISDDMPRTWHLLQKQADGGIAGILHGLTKEECEFARNRIEGHPATDQERAEDEARRKRQADGWTKWKTEHHCKEGVFGSEVTSGSSDQAADGTCAMGREFGGITMGRSYSPHDVMTAECFQ